MPPFRKRDGAQDPERRRVFACFLDLFLAIGILALLDVWLFHYGGYLPILKPGSFSGRLEATLHRLAFMSRRVGNKRFVLIAGNSTAEGAVNERLLEEQLLQRGTPFPVLNVSRGGNSVVAWSYLFKDVPEFSDRSRCLIYGLSMPYLVRHHSSRRLDVSVVKTRLRVRDAPSLARRQPNIEAKLAVLTGGLFRTIFFREDLADLIRHPRVRRRHLRVERRFDARLRRGLRRTNATSRRMPKAVLKGGRLMPSVVPPWLPKISKGQRTILARMRREASGQLRENRNRPRVSRMSVDLLEGMVEFLNARKIHVVFALLPSTPYPYGPRGTEAIETLVRQWRGRGLDLSLFNEPRLLRILEHPRFFRDFVHLNVYGEKRYTVRLARFLADDLRRSQPRGEAAGSPPPS